MSVCGFVFCVLCAGFGAAVIRAKADRSPGPIHQSADWRDYLLVTAVGCDHADWFRLRRGDAPELRHHQLFCGVCSLMYPDPHLGVM